MDTHTVGVERINKTTRAHATIGTDGPAIGTLAVVERYNGTVVTVGLTSADVRRTPSVIDRYGTVTAALKVSGQQMARSYGATWIDNTSTSAAS